MDYKNKKKELVEEYNKNQQVLVQLTQRQQQIIGQVQLIEEVESKKDEGIQSNRRRK
jgi:ABC-type uncharacterized transport system ATPase subunit